MLLGLAEAARVLTDSAEGAAAVLLGFAVLRGFRVRIPVLHFIRDAFLDLDQHTRVVSYDDEPLILVDAHDREQGYLDKAAAHSGAGVLHRAFSVFLFDGSGRVLMQKRAAGKRLWPGFWSNACCSHPRRGEQTEDAVHRRLLEELNIEAELSYLFKFEYASQYDEDGAEHELCWVYAGRISSLPSINLTEMSDVCFQTRDQIDRSIQEQPDSLTPWFKIEWAHIKKDHSQWLSAS